MQTKAFIWLVVGTLVVGVGIGAIIAIVLALGDGQGEGTSQGSLPTQSASGTVEPRPLSQPEQQLVGEPRQPIQSDEANQEEGTAQGSLPEQSTSGTVEPRPLNQTEQQLVEEPRQPIQSDEADQEDLAQTQQSSSDGQLGQGSGGVGGRGLTGTIEKIESNTVTVNTPQGTSLVSIGEETIIQMFAEGTLSDLETGIRATLVGQRGEDGVVVAAFISIVPEGFLGARGFSGQLGQEPDGEGQLSRIRERIQSGEITQEELAELRQQARDLFRQGGSGQFGRGGLGGQGFGGGDGLTGTIEKIEGNAITVNTPQGPLRADIVEETIIQMFKQGAPGDLQTGMRITVMGLQGEDGDISANSILIVPEGVGDFSGSDRFGN